MRRKNAGLPHVRVHDLRHSAAMLSVDDNVHPELLRRRLGHSRVQVTIDLYMREPSAASSTRLRHGSPLQFPRVCERLATRGVAEAA